MNHTGVSESANLNTPPATTVVANDRRRRARRHSHARSMFAHGEPFIWLTGGALVTAIAMILGLLLLIASLGLATFVPSPLIEVKLRDGRVLMGELSKQDRFSITAAVLFSEAAEVQSYLAQHLIESIGDPSQFVARVEAEIQVRESELQSLESTLQSLEQTMHEDIEQIANTDDAFQRAALLRNEARDDAFEKHQQRSAARMRRADTVRGELETARHAVEYFRAQPKIDAASLVAADESVRLFAANTMIAMALEQDPESMTFRRRLLRTGNFELTNEHFNWVADYQIAPEGETLPVQGTLIERLSWGRFFGRPKAAVVEHRRSSDASPDLYAARLVEFWQSESASLGTLDQADAAAFQRVAETLAQHRQSVDKAGTEAFLATFRHPPKAAQQWLAVTNTGERKRLKDLNETEEVAAVWEVIDDPELAWQEFRRIHPSLLSLQERSQHLEKHDLGRQYARQEAARLDVRQAELDCGTELLKHAEAQLIAKQALASTRSHLAELDAMASYASRTFGDTSETNIVVRRLTEQRRATLVQQQTQQQAALVAFQQTTDRLPAAARTAVQHHLAVESEAHTASSSISDEIAELRDRVQQHQLIMETADHREKSLAMGDIVRAFQPNRLSRGAAWKVYLSRWWEFLTADPREANSEGGVLPAIWGTVVMTLVMSLAVVPFGVMAALYLREYAKPGPFVSLIRIAINNLAGVPSIVFGVFGLGFFCYLVGAYLDGGPRNAGVEPLPGPRWYLLLIALAAIASVAFVGSLIGFSGRRGVRPVWKRALGIVSTILWFTATGLLFYAIFKTPHFAGFYAANLPNPYWGKGGVLWAALTLALMTLPVVIVATEDALAAVPNSMREGSYGCGASKWQTIRRIVLPHALPGIMTGMILAMARGAGEVAPLMLVGAVKLAPELPIDHMFPYLHGNRSFMHLGFHIFDVGFQSQNSEAAKPMVYTTTLLLIVLITALNLLAVWLRAHLRKRFAMAEFQSSHTPTLVRSLPRWHKAFDYRFRRTYLLMSHAMPNILREAM